MQILASAASRLRDRLRSTPSRTSHPRPEPSGHLPIEVAAYPIGQSYSWGHPPSGSNGFAPAIGYDGYHAGNGY